MSKGLLALPWLGLMGLLGLTALVYAQSDVDRRIADIERVEAGSRLARIETRIDSLESIGKGVVTILAGQLLLSGLGMAHKKRER